MAVSLGINPQYTPTMVFFSKDVNGNPSIIVDAVNGIIPAVKTTYDNGVQLMRVVDFDQFSLQKQNIVLLCIEFLWNPSTNSWQQYNSGFFSDSRFKADNTTMVDPATGLQEDEFYTYSTTLNPNYDNTQPIDPIINPQYITTQTLKSGLSIPNPATFVPQFTWFLKSPIGQAIIGFIYQELISPDRN